MKRKVKYFFCIFLLVFAFLHQAVSQKITDTIFYNKKWAICEKPLAAYYRIGTLAIDSFWFYTGKVKDYTVADSLIMDGEYSQDGYKNGVFNFYYPNGKLHVSGQFLNDKMSGNWKWNYPDGTLEAIIDFPEEEKNFRFITYRDEAGKVILENGTGDFVWHSDIFRSKFSGYKVQGSFKMGKRCDTWKYYRETGIGDLQCKETYSDDGRFKRGRWFGIQYNEQIDSSIIHFNFTPDEIKITELMTYDDFFRKSGKDKADLVLVNYLLNRTSSEITVKDSSFEKAFSFMLNTLDSYRDKFDYTSKEINGTITFKLGEKGYPEDISINGENITEKEKEFLFFLMNKFRNIQMPGTNDVAIEGYHTIYFYAVNMKQFMPVEIRQFVGMDLFFSPLKKEQFITVMQGRKREMKKYIRDEFRNFW